ncbi:transcription factor [Fusarium langsethiae]|uniref:Transcription factor n=1 Tax=Fusarium langsethiae TaxID=179993 RepID=A0A0M9EYQ1_FUSLA|nr:transcription factor [Fusarium langsethiae]GKU02521.1 unnamed protein product [Fusarium langsethiae]GKU21616.1 unnamed protein product [Fusarium langsethiae]
MLIRRLPGIIIQKVTHLLHHHSFANGPTGEDSIRCHESYIKAVLVILKYRHRMSEESQPGRIMHAIRWSIAVRLSFKTLRAIAMLCHKLSRYDMNRPLDRREDLLWPKTFGCRVLTDRLKPKELRKLSLSY